MKYSDTIRICKILKEEDVPYTIEFCNRKKGRSSIVSVVELRGYITLKEIVYEPFRVVVNIEKINNNTLDLIISRFNVKTYQDGSYITLV